MQGPGDIVYVPSGWIHATVNIRLHIHREELEEETYQVAKKKKEKEKVEIGIENGNLKHAIRMLGFGMKCDYVQERKQTNRIVPCLSQQPKWKVRKD